MNDTNGVIPHGGELIDLRVDEERAHLLKEITLNLPDITLNERQMCDLELLACGAFSPLKGFMTRSDYESVLDRMRLQNDVLWPIPICLDVDGLRARKFEAGPSPCGILKAICLRSCTLKTSGRLNAKKKPGLFTGHSTKAIRAPNIC
jgi:sulfate adenylyltransferase